MAPTEATGSAPEAAKEEVSTMEEVSISEHKSESPQDADNQAGTDGQTGSAEAHAAELIDEKYRQISRIVLYLCFAASGVIAVIAIWQLASAHAEKYVIVWSVGAFFVSIAVPISLHGIHMNIVFYRHKLQRHYIRILWMIPIYAIESWLALRFNASKFYLETARETYEAFVIYSFYDLMRGFLGNTREEQVATLKEMAIESKKTHAHHMRAAFLCFADYLPKWEIGEQFLRNTSLGVLQYVPLQILFAFLVLISVNIRTDEPCYVSSRRRLVDSAADHWIRRSTQNVTNTTDVEYICPNYYGEGKYQWNRVYVYKLLIMTLSQTWALYNMIFFYHETRARLQELRPLTKLITVKGVVFVAFWQGCIISGAVSMHWVSGYTLLSYSPSDVADGLQNWMICVEMALVAGPMYYAFRYKDFEGERLGALLMDKTLTPMHALRDMVPEDVMKETYDHSKVVLAAAHEHGKEAVKKAHEQGKEVVKKAHEHGSKAAKAVADQTNRAVRVAQNGAKVASLVLAFFWGDILYALLHLQG